MDITSLYMITVHKPRMKLPPELYESKEHNVVKSASKIHNEAFKITVDNGITSERGD